MLRDVFALSDLENKNANIDTELSSATIYDAAILKRLTGRQPIRIQRKNQRAYDTKLYAKLFFSANKIPASADDSDAYYRRNIILSFPNQFEEGKNADPDLLEKLTTEEELSGIFNILMVALRNVLRNKRIFINERTIQERRIKYELASKPVECFKQDAIAEESTEYDRTYKEAFYRAYEIFVRENKLAKTSKENLGKILKTTYGFQEGRESSGKRRTFWKGIKLAERYHYLIQKEQQVLTV
jgi:phage/plasmid-associated DNA primase